MGLSCNPPTPPDMRVRIRRFGTLRFPKQADLSVVAFSSPAVPVPHFAVLSGFTLSSGESSVRAAGAPISLTNSTDLRVCRNALNLPKNAPVSVNFHTYNTICRGFSLTPLFNALWAHEGLGTQNPLDPNLANGHEARRRIAARLPSNDPYRIAEPMFRLSYAQLQGDLTLDVYTAEQQISAASDAGHLKVGNNYVTPQGNCGKAWVFDTSVGRFVNIALQISRPPLAPICP